MTNLSLVLIREETKPVEDGEWFTPGKMFANGQMFCQTCEDRDRKLEVGGVKVKGQTAIPRGKYKVIVTFSNRFQRPLPEVLDVPGYTGVRFHGGNKAEDSEGCILIGQVRTDTGIANCRPTVERLIKMIESAEDTGGSVWLEVK